MKLSGLILSASLWAFGNAQDTCDYPSCTTTITGELGRNYTFAWRSGGLWPTGSQLTIGIDSYVGQFVDMIFINPQGLDFGMLVAYPGGTYPEQDIEKGYTYGSTNIERTKFEGKQVKITVYLDKSTDLPPKMARDIEGPATAPQARSLNQRAYN